MSHIVERQELKLASLLVSGSSTSREKRNELDRIRNKLKRLKERDPAKYAALFLKYSNVLSEIKQFLEKEAS